MLRNFTTSNELPFPIHKTGRDTAPFLDLSQFSLRQTVCVDNSGSDLSDDSSADDYEEEALESEFENVFADEAGNTNLHLAILNRDRPRLLHLLDPRFVSPQAISYPNNASRTPMHLAAEHGMADLVWALFGAGASIHCTDDDGATPLHYAAALGNPATILRLVQCGANLNTGDAVGDRPLHYAVRESNSATVQALLRLGASPFCVNDDSESPLDLAIIVHEPAIIKLLKQGPIAASSPSSSKSDSIVFSLV